MVEYNTPEELLLDEGSSFSKMVQSTGYANAQYLRSLVLGEEGHKNNSGREEVEAKQLNRRARTRWVASSSWAAATQAAISISLTSSQNGLQFLDIEDETNILKKTNDAVITLRGVLEGTHDEAIEEILKEYQVPRDGWWSSLYKMVEGIA